METRLSASYPARYRDQWGEEETTIKNDGFQMRMLLRGLEFRSEGLYWRPYEVDPSQLLQFSFTSWFNGSERPFYLTYNTLAWDVPISVVDRGQLLPAILHVEHGWESGPKIGEVILTLSVADQIFTTRGKAAISHYVQEGKDEETGEWPQIYNFERALGVLHEQLPEGMYLKICLFCSFSDYNPTGPIDLFGYLECYKKDKQTFLSVSSRGWRRQHPFKSVFWRLQRDFVQETYCCPEFQRRSPDHEGPPYPPSPL